MLTNSVWSKILSFPIKINLCNFYEVFLNNFAKINKTKKGDIEINFLFYLVRKSYSEIRFWPHKIKQTPIGKISLLIELIAKTYRMGKNNSGATPAHAPMSISTHTHEDNIQSKKKKRHRKTCIPINYLSSSDSTSYSGSNSWLFFI